MVILRLLNVTIVILSDHGDIYIDKAFRYGIDPIPEWFDKISQRTKELDVMVDGSKVKTLDIRLENGILRAFYGYYIGMYPDNSIQVFRPEDFHSLYTLKL